MALPDATAYNPQDVFTKTKSAAYGFGTSQRKSLADYTSEKIPGPGQYVIPPKAFETQSRFAMGIKYKELSKTFIPGPGQYEANTNFLKKSMPAFS